MEITINNEQFKINSIKQTYIYDKNLVDTLNFDTNGLTAEEFEVMSIENPSQLTGIVYFDIEFIPCEELTEDKLWEFGQYFNEDHNKKVVLTIKDNDINYSFNEMIKIERPSDGNTNYIITFSRFNETI